jgi:hypothetical protein
MALVQFACALPSSAEPRAVASFPVNQGVPESGEREPMGLRSQPQLWFGSESRLHQQNYRAEMQSGT